jgi:hypothetical protein
MDLIGLDDEEIWVGDPVHTQPSVYLRIASAVIRTSDAMSQEALNKRRCTTSVNNVSSGGMNEQRDRHESDTRAE